MSGHENFTRSLQEKSSSDRSFGWVFTVFFLLVGLLPLLRHKPVRIWGLAASGGFLLITLMRPTLFSGPNRVWMKLAQLLSQVANPLMTGILFYVVLTPIGMLQRLLGNDILRLKPNRQPSYWIDRNPPGPGPDTMTNQF